MRNCGILKNPDEYDGSKRFERSEKNFLPAALAIVLFTFYIGGRIIETIEYESYVNELITSEHFSSVEKLLEENGLEGYRPVYPPGDNYMWLFGPNGESVKIEFDEKGNPELAMGGN